MNQWLKSKAKKSLQFLIGIVKENLIKFNNTAN